MSSVHLRSFDNSSYSPGRPYLVQVLWFLLGAPLLRCPVLPSSAVRAWLLRLFGAEIGSGPIIRPGVRVKYPWNLRAGNDCWIGEDCWIDNLARVSLGSDVCLSQGVYLCTGNHNWSDPAFGLVVKEIAIGDGAWIGAKAVVAPGVRVGECGIAAMGSVINRDIPAREVHAGNPAQFVTKRKFYAAAHARFSDIAVAAETK